MNLRQRLAGLTPPAPKSAHKTEVLADLRRKMADILGREPVVASAPVRDFAAAGFELYTSPLGELYRRKRTLAASHHVGFIPIEAAADADAQMLALLALDPALSSCPPERALFLDTETTGLHGGGGTLAFLLGLGWFDEQRKFCLEQWLLQEPSEEAALLEVLRERLLRASVLVTYNGRTFDWPLLRDRYVMNRLVAPTPPPHLDLLHVARRLHRARTRVCRLITLESDVLGFARGPDVEGAEIGACYAHFLRTGEPSGLLRVVEHNAWDVLSMAALVGLYGEPLELLVGSDLVGLAQTLKRARALEQADHAINRAVSKGGGERALRVRGEIAKARGDRSRVLSDFEALAATLDDPALRLELAKLYEHFVKEPRRALLWAEQGTGEAEPGLSRRRGRLERKIQKLETPNPKKPGTRRRVGTPAIEE